MHSRKKMIKAIENGQSISQAARQAGVSRPTASLWWGRAQQEGVEAISERSRRPHRCHGGTPAAEVEPLLELKGLHPGWGAKKLLALLERQGRPAPYCVRTADRLLARHGLTTPRHATPAQALQRFVHPRCNGLWQMDFKGMGKPSVGYWPLSVLDDHSRYALAFEPLQQQETSAVFAVLWRLFGIYGMPERLLSDNGSCFAGTWTQNGPCRLELKLWLLGIETTHGRPYHPQTQGKVERFHRTIGEEARSRGVALRAPDVQQAREAYAPLIEIYNWVRPHEELEMKTPGEVYEPSPRLRPARLPEHELPAQAIKRKVCSNGTVSWRGQCVRVGKGLAGEWVKVQEQEHEWVFCFAEKIVAPNLKDPQKV